MINRRYFIGGLVALALLLNIQPYAYGKLPPKNGVIREVYSNGRVHYEFRYKRGQMIRKRAWYRSGRLMLDYRYRDGQPYQKKDFYENGRLKSVWHKKTGLMKVYHDNGSLKVSVGSRSDGLYH